MVGLLLDIVLTFAIAIIAVVFVGVFRAMPFFTGLIGSFILQFQFPGLKEIIPGESRASTIALIVIVELVILSTIWGKYVKLHFSEGFYTSYDRAGMVIVIVAMVVTVIGNLVRDRLELADKEIVEPLEDDMLSDWLDNPVAFGAFEGDTLIGFVEGFLEEWNNRYRISNICVFDSGLRSKGVGTALLETILDVAANSGARMAVLETQSYNSKAISFYKKNGFEIIGFDRYAYSNDGPEEHNMRIEMGKKLC